MRHYIGAVAEHLYIESDVYHSVNKHKRRIFNKRKHSQKINQYAEQGCCAVKENVLRADKRKQKPHCNKCRRKSDKN